MKALYAIIRILDSILRFKQEKRSDQICIPEGLIEQQCGGWLVGDRTPNVCHEAVFLSCIT